MKLISVIIAIGLLSGCAVYPTQPVYYTQPEYVAVGSPVVVVHGGYYHRGWR